MNIVQTVLIVLALICFLLSALGVSSRVNLQSLGLFFWSLAVLLAAVVRH